MIVDKIKLTRLDIMVLVSIILVGLVHLPYPFDGDQALFTMGASKISRGAILYRDFWDVKQPAIFGFYLLGGLAFGFTEVGIHTFELLYMTTFAAVLLFTLKGYCRSAAIASLAPLLTIGVYYAVTESWHLTQVEGLVGFPMFLSLWFSCNFSPRNSRRTLRLLVSGLMGGLVLLFKLMFLPILLAFWLTALIVSVRQGESISTALLRTLVPVAIGVALPLLAVISYFAWFGNLALLYYTSLEYPVRAFAQLPGKPFHRLITGLFWFLGRFSTLMALAFIGVWRLLSRRSKLGRRDVLTVNLLLWLILGLGVIFLQRLSYWEYHYMLLFVPLGVLALKGLDVLWERIKQIASPLSSRRGRVAFAITVAFLFLPFFTSLTLKVLYLGYYGFAYGQEQRLQYQAQISDTYQKVRSDVEFLSKPESLAGGMFVGGNPLYYYLSGRDQAISSNGWMLDLFLPQQWGQLNKELADTLPPYIFLSPAYSALGPERSPQTSDFIDQNYRVLRSSTAGVWYVVKERQSGRASSNILQRGPTR